MTKRGRSRVRTQRTTGVVDAGFTAHSVAKGRRLDQSTARGSLKRGGRGRVRGRGRRGGSIAAHVSGKETLVEEEPHPSTSDEPVDQPPQKDSASPVEKLAVAESGSSYFESHRDATVRTSSDTLANIKLPSAAILAESISALGGHIPEDIASSILARKTRREAMERYAYLIGGGYSLLFYGFGSKIGILEKVAQALADDAGDSAAVFVVMGFNPSFNLRTVLSNIVAEVVPSSVQFARRSLLDYVRAIRDSLKQLGHKKRLIIVVHNIDGIALRSAEAQNVFSELAEEPRAAIVASIDHINAPLLWDGSQLLRFRWAWIPATTFEPYTSETTLCSRPLLEGSDERRVEAAIVLLNSLSVNARKAFRLLARRQIDTRPQVSNGVEEDNAGSGNEGGVSRAQKRPPPVSHGVLSTTRTTFIDFYSRCREEFLVSDPANLRTMLTELETHNLLDRRRAADAAEQLWIPLSASQLLSVLEAIAE